MRKTSFFVRQLLFAVFTIFIVFLIFIIPSPSSARSWDDLYEKTSEKLIGSEKERKMKADLPPLYQWESWEDHSSVMVFFWFYKSENYPRYSSTKILPFGFLWRETSSKVDNRSYGFVPILLTYWETDRNENYRVNPLFFDAITESSGSNTNYYERINISLLHGYYSERNGTNEKGKTVFWAPIIPILTYNNTDDYGGHRNFLMLIDYSWDTVKGEESMKRFWLMPLFWHSVGNDGYTVIIPPIWIDNRHENGERYWHIFPLFGWSKDVSYQYDERNKSHYVYERSLLTIPFCFSNSREDSWDGPITRERFWFPIIPVYYSYSETGGESHRNLLWLFDWHNNEKKATDRFWAAPFVFWKSESYLHVLPPLYMSFAGKDYSYNHLLPLFVNYDSASQEYYPSSKKYESVYSSSFFSLWEVSFKDRKDSSDGEVTASTKWFPILPIFYYSSEEKGIGSHRNIIGLLDWHNDAKNNTDRFWAAPFVFWKSESYLHLLPPVYMSFAGKDYSYNHLLPLFVSLNSKESRVIDGKPETVENSHFFTPLWGWASSKNSTTQESLSRSVWFPILPMYYDNYDETGTHTNVFGLVDWARDRFDGLERFWLMPFVFYKEGGGYRVFAPFYIKPSGWTQERGYSFGLFHYNSWSPECNTTWILPVWFNRNNRETGNYVNLILPLYYNVESRERDTTLFLPLYFNTENKKTGNKFHLDILGLARSVTSGPNPNIDVGAGKSEYGYYFDTEVSWLYEFFSISTRSTFYQTTPKPEFPPEETKLADKSSLSKEDAVNYWGLNMLYGLINFKSADTKYHVRILPLCWLTWDTSQQNNSYWFLTFYHATTPQSSLYVLVPAFFSYTAPDTDYFALTPLFIPLYGSQHIKKSYRYAFLLNLYWNEYNDELNLHEHTMLWPFINFYYSPTKGGSRFVPLYWYKRVTEEGREYSRSLSLLHYYSHEKNERADGVRDTASTLYLPILPVLYYRTSTATESPDHIKTESRRKFIFPLYYSFVTEQTEPGKDTEATGHTFCWGYYSSYNPETFYWTFFGLFSSTTSQKDTNADYSSSWLFGLHNHSRENGIYSNYTFPLYSWSSWDDGYQIRFLLGLFSKNDDATKNEYSSSWSALWWLVSSRTTLTSSVTLKGYTSEKSNSWVIPLFFTHYEGFNSIDSAHTERTTISPLFVSNYETTDNKGTDLLYWAPIVPLVFYHSTDTFTHLDIALLFDYKTNKSTGITSKRLAPLYFSKSGSDGYFGLLPPFFMHWWNDDRDENSKVILGLYVTRSPDYERQNFLYLFDHIKNVREKYEKTSFIFNAFSKETSAQDVEYAFLWGGGFKYKRSTVNDDYERTGLFYLIAQKQLGDYYQNRFLPFWYYSHDKNESSLLIPPALTYINRGSDGSEFHVVGLGALWYRNYDAQKGSDRQMVLLGIPYYAVSHPEERGYSSTGVLWGILYDDESEADTGFEKISILKFLYKRVTIDGQTTHSVLGISF